MTEFTLDDAYETFPYMERCADDNTEFGNLIEANRRPTVLETMRAMRPFLGEDYTYNVALDFALCAYRAVWIYKEGE